MLCLTFDSEIHRLCEKSGFVLQSSRKKKFEIFFYSLAAYIVFTVFYLAYSANWNAPEDWIINIVTTEKATCAEKLETSFNFNIGLSATYDSSALLFFLIGMVFG